MTFPSKATINIAVIGSSPLMLMQAQTLAQKGATVTVFESRDTLGGAWRNHTLANGVETETACHLIEAYHGIYDVLSKASGVDFKPLSPQPIKVFEDGKSKPYSSRRAILIEFTKRCLVQTMMSVTDVTSFGLTRLARWKKSRTLTTEQYWADLKLFARHKIPLLWSGAKVHHPVGGCVAFMNGLIARSQTLGVMFCEAKVSALKPVGQRKWLINDRTEPYDRVFLSASSAFTLDQKSMIATQPHTGEYFHSVMELPAEEFLRLPPQYVHFPGHRDVHRFTLVDAVQPIGASQLVYFLIQFRGPQPDANAREALAQETLNLLSLTTNNVRPSEVAAFQEEFVATNDDSLLTKSAPPAGLTVLHSVGDLARTIAQWRAINPDGK